MTPHVPIKVSEIIENLHQACEIGITKIHLLAREEISGESSYEKEIYRKITKEIRKYDPQIVICGNLSGRNFSGFEFRSDPLFLKGGMKPEMASLILSSLNFNNVASSNSPEMIQDLAHIMEGKHIVPELEVFM